MVAPVPARPRPVPCLGGAVARLADRVRPDLGRIERRHGGAAAGGRSRPVRRQRDAAQQAAVRRISDGVGAVNTMSTDTRTAALLAQARGIDIVPRYGHAALGVAPPAGLAC